MNKPPNIFCFFFFNDTATTEIYTLSLHDALPILTPTSWLYAVALSRKFMPCGSTGPPSGRMPSWQLDRKSTRLNSSHLVISYAVFCLKKKKEHDILIPLYHDVVCAYR